MIVKLSDLTQFPKNQYYVLKFAENFLFEKKNPE